MAIAALQIGDEVEAGRPDIAGLDAVDAIDAAEQVVMAANRAAAEGEEVVAK